jgi:hypothetical protein
MDEREQWMITYCLLGLAACIMLHGIAIARIRRDVQFVTVLAEKRMTSA